jgi:hypothetical protein
MVRWTGACVALVCVLAACGSSSKPTGTSVGSTTTTLHPGLAVTTTLPDESTTTATSSANAVALNMHAKGTIDGVDFDGPVAGSSLQCSPSGDGNYVAVDWGGTIVIKGQGEQIVGDMNLKIGGTTFPSGGTASITLKGDYQHRVGATSGTATADAKSGTINAEYSAGADHAALQGTWRCT